MPLGRRGAFTGNFGISADATIPFFAFGLEDLTDFFFPGAVVAVRLAIAINVSKAASNTSDVPSYNPTPFQAEAVTCL